MARGALGGDAGRDLHPRADPLEALARRDRGAISVYAQARDYHDVVKKRLKRLGRWLIEAAGGEIKVFVDTAPVMEKPLAEAAGLGWQGKHTNLLSRNLGNWFFLGAIFTTLELPPDAPGEEHCGSCRRCLDICPTDAFPAPFQLDARRCISYLTIEHHGPVDEALRPGLGNRIYGCDDCLAVCPWNKFAAEGARGEVRSARPDLVAPRLADLAALDDAGFRRAVLGLADQADRARPLRAQRGLRDRQFRPAGAAPGGAAAWPTTPTRRWPTRRAGRRPGWRDPAAAASAAPSRRPSRERAMPARGENPVLEAYRGYATPDALVVRGRVLTALRRTKPEPEQSKLANLLQMVSLFLTSEVAGVPVIRPRDAVMRARATRKAICALEVPRAAAHAPGWHEVAVEIAGAAADAPGGFPVLVPRAEARPACIIATSTTR